ncbi:hypothetical protein PHYPSEUDO_003056 [Phytophthora pseudosyringae]|uniref:RxLR effector protein n=1 Tax=Phytophthora pseudosyringae TaxID=221518 RepID=A0A8T1VS91_9STRA|nr:hypothetical protein PHYPSEUDO_003056 [Phytophthora pseudosyringae]
MRLHNILLLVVACFLGAFSTLVDSGSLDVSTGSAVRSNQISRLLRDGGAAEAHTSENGEERATADIAGHIFDKRATKQVLKFFVERGVSVDHVKVQYLGMPSWLSYNELLKHRNWKALVKYQRMKWEQANGKTPYAFFGSGFQNEEKTKEMLLAWVVADNSVEKVGKYLGVWGLPRSEQIVHQNWRAFKTYTKWFTQYQQGMKKLRYAKFGTGYHTEDKTKEVLTQWAMAGTSVTDVQKTLGLTGLSAAQMARHENYAAFLKYMEYYLQLAPIRARHAVNA